MKKFKTLLTCLLVACCSLFLFACNNKKDNNVTISFYTTNGNLSFSSVTINQNESLTSANIPTVSGEGDNLIFSSWKYKTGEAFDINSKINKDIELYACFEAADLVWCTTWTKNQSILSKRLGDNPQNYATFSGYSSNITQPDSNFIKMAKKDINESYITKDEFLNTLDESMCFKVEQSTPKFVEKSDLTDSTYKFHMFISTPLNGFKGVGYYDYLPKGTKFLINSEYHFREIFSRYYHVSIKDTSFSSFLYGCFGIEDDFGRILVSDESLPLRNEDFNSIANLNQYDRDAENFNNNNYYFIMRLKGFKFAYYSQELDRFVYNYLDSDTGYLNKDVSKAIYDSIDADSYTKVN